MTTLSTTKWGFEIYNSSGLLIADLAGLAQDRKFILVRNREGSATFSLDEVPFTAYCSALSMNPSDVLSVFRNDLKIHINGVYLYGGPLTHWQINEAGKIEVRSMGYFGLLKYRYLPDSLSYTNTDAGQIAKGLVVNIQTSMHDSSFGFTEGTIQTSVNRDRNYPIYKNEYEAMVQLSEVINGFDFEITHEKKLNVYYPMQGVDNTDIELSYPGNINSFSYSTDGTQLANRHIVRGSGYGNDQKVWIHDDAPYQAAYRELDSILDYPDVSKSTTLEEYAEGYTEIYKEPLNLLEVTINGNKDPIIGTYGIGDRIPISIRKGNTINFTKQKYRIDAIETSIDDGDNSQIKLILSRFYD